MKKATTRVTIVIIFLIVVVVGYYCYLVNRSRSLREGNGKDITMVENVLARNLDNDYPPTPKEVMKYYHEIMKCFYNEDCTDEQIELLGKRAMALYDSELAANNEWESYMLQLKSEITDYKEKKRRITSFSVASSSDVEFFDEDGYHFARIRCSYNVMEEKQNRPVAEIYLLRKDDKNHWKIYGWKKEDQVQIQQESGETD